MKKCLLVLILFGLNATVFGQMHNGEIYHQLLKDFFETQNSFASVSGNMIQPWTPALSTDSTSTQKLRIMEAQLQYSILASGDYQRQLSIPLNLQDSVLHSLQLEYSDTLSREGFRRIYRKSPEQLRGDNPSIAARWIRPVLLVGLSIGSLFSLFYLRSQ